MFSWRFFAHTDSTPGGTMTEAKDLKYLSNFDEKLGVCVKDPQKQVLYQNEKSIRICGNQVGQTCSKGCMTVYKTVDECSAISEGMKLFKGVKIDEQIADAVVISDGESITSLLYSLNDGDSKFQKQKEYFEKSGLTKSEIRIMQMVSQGMSNAAICEQLYISRATLKTHLNNVYKKLPSLRAPRLQR